MHFSLLNTYNRTLFVSRKELEKCKKLLTDKSMHLNTDPEKLWKAKKSNKKIKAIIHTRL